MVKKILKWLFYIILTIVLGIAASVYLFKDRIIQQVLTEVNNYLTVPVNVSKVNIDLLHGLPNISIAFYDVELPANSDPIIEARKLYAIVNPLEIIRGQLEIKRIELIDADLQLYVDKSNEINIGQIFKKADTTNLDVEDTTSTGFSLNKILLKNVRIAFVSDLSGVSSKAIINELNGSFHLRQGSYESEVKAEIELLEHKSPAWQVKDVGVFTYDFDVEYNVESKLLTLDKSQFTFRGAEADLTGNVTFTAEPEVDLNIEADEVSFELLSELLPARAVNFIKQYQSKGSIGLKAELKGKFVGKKMPALTAELQFSDVDLTQEQFMANINDLNLRCQLAMKDVANLSSGTFSITESAGKLLDRPFNIAFSLANFAKPKFSGKIEAGITSSWLLAALQFDEYTSATGDIDLSVNFSNQESQEGLLESLNLSGLLNFNEVGFSLNDSVQVQAINGQARFTPEQIALSNLTLNWLSSDIKINGNILDKIAEDKTIEFTLRSDVQSKKLAIEDIVSLVRASSNLFVADTTSTTDVKLDLDLFASFDSLTFQRFKGAHISGNITLQDEVLELVDLNGRAMGGALKVNGMLKQMTNQDIVIQAQAKTKGVYIDSLFYVFNNFTQNFIREENLRGRVYADAEASMFFDKEWRFRRQLLSAYAKIGIVGGELKNFEPLMALSPYLDDKDDNLANLRFSDLVNNVQIKQDTIFIPEMSIRTNVRNIALGGYHTLNQHINYQLAVPIINERVDKDEAFGAVKKSSKGSPNLLFRIKGTTSDYRVNYDLLRATGNVLKLIDITKIFRKKEEAESDSSFLDDEEFDWQ